MSRITRQATDSGKQCTAARDSLIAVRSRRALLPLMALLCSPLFDMQKCCCHSVAAGNLPVMGIPEWDCECHSLKVLNDQSCVRDLVPAPIAALQTRTVATRAALKDMHALASALRRRALAVTPARPAVPTHGKSLTCDCASNSRQRNPCGLRLPKPAAGPRLQLRARKLPHQRAIPVRLGASRGKGRRQGSPPSASSQSSGSVVQTADAPPCTCTASLKLPPQAMRSLSSLALTPDGRRVVTGSEHGHVSVWDLHTGQSMQEASSTSHQEASTSIPDPSVKERGQEINCLTVAKDGRWAVSGSSDGGLRCWDLERGECSDLVWAHTGNGQTWPIRRVVITPDGRHAVSSGDDERLCVWALEAGKVVGMLARIDVRSFGGLGLCGQMAICPDGLRVVASMCYNTILSWEAGRGVSLIGCLHCSSVLEYVGVTCDGWRAVSWGEDQMMLESSQACMHGELLVWDVESGKLVANVGGNLQSAAVSCDCRIAVTGCCDGSVQLWDLGEGECLATLGGHDAKIWGVAITPDGCHAVSLDEDGQLHAWALGEGLATVGGSFD